MFTGLAYQETKWTGKKKGGKDKGKSDAYITNLGS